MLNLVKARDDYIPLLEFQDRNDYIYKMMFVRKTPIDVVTLREINKGSTKA